MTTFNQSEVPTYCQWEVWQVNWDHEDGTIKDRPVIILSSTATAQANQEIWVAKFTKSRKEIPFRIEFKDSDPSFPETGLSKTCYLYIAEARKIPKSAFLHRRGKLSVLSAVMAGFIVKQALKFKIP